jgi:thiol-disulfide isomerase/thioredoxin
MKKFFLYILTCAFLSSAFAQNKAPKEIKIGDIVPDTILRNVVLYKKPELKLSDFKDKYIIIDLWATWCSPCVAMLKKTDSIQNALPNDIQFISITAEATEMVEKFLNNYNLKYNTKVFSVTNERYLWYAFKHYSIPHYIWLDKNRKVVAITDYFQVTYDKVAQFVRGNLKIKQKTDRYLFPDTQLPLFEPMLTNPGRTPDTTVDRTLNKGSVLWHSTFTKYQPAYRALQSFGKNHIVAVNSNIERLYAQAYGETSLDYTWMNRWMWTATNPDAWSMSHAAVDHMDYNTWASKNTFTYELSTLEGMSERETYKIMLQELNAYFGKVYKIKGSLKDTLIDCMVLEETGQPSSYQTKDTTNQKNLVGQFEFNVQSVPMSYFYQNLCLFYQFEKAPLVNDVKYKGNVSLKLSGDLKQFDNVNAGLIKYGLRIVRKKMMTKMIVIEDL